MADLCAIGLSLLHGGGDGVTALGNGVTAIGDDVTAAGYHVTSGGSGFLSSHNRTVSLENITHVLFNFSRTLGETNGSERYYNGSLSDRESYGSDPRLEAMRFYLANVVNPVICVFGLFGNAFNVLVLSRRRMRAVMDCAMERGAHAGLMALAISDDLYCACALFDSVLSRPHSVFPHRNIGFYARVYGKYLLTTLARTGTWLTVIMAAGRYAAICRPIQARSLLGATSTRVAIVFTFVFWTLVGLPLLWTYRVEDVDCLQDGHFILIDLGDFVLAHDGGLKMTFTYFWALLGFFLPVVLLVYFNYYLIRALRESSKMRSLYRVNPRLTSTGSHVTPTLVAIVCLLLILVTPSELLRFYYFGIRQDKVESFTLAIVVTNVLQTTNFAFNFVLYCIVNARFRETWKDLLCCGWCGESRRTVSRREALFQQQQRGSTRSTLRTAI